MEPLKAFLMNASSNTIASLSSIVCSTAKSDCFETQKIFALSCNMKYFLRPNENPPVSTLLQEVPTAIEQEMVDE